MCYAVTCRVCGKATWDGCGHHVEDVMRSVPAAQQCRCAERAEPRRGITATLQRRFNG